MKVSAKCGDNMTGRTRAQIVLVIVAVLCLKFERGTCESVTTEEISTLPTNSADSVTDTTLFEDTTTNETPTSVIATEDLLHSTQSPCQAAKGLTVVPRLITSNSIHLTWTQQADSAKCRFKYDIHIKKAKLDLKEIPYFRHNSKTGHVFKNLEECTAYNVSIKSSSGAVYKATFRTFPEELKNITIYEDKGTFKAKWGPSTNEDCLKYRISIDTNHTVVSDNFATLGFSKDLRCSEVKISAVDVADNIGDPVIRLVPGEIQNLKATPDNFAISLVWDEPEDVTCVEKYIVRVDGETFETIVTSFELTDLDACTSYEIEVAAISTTDTEGPSASISTKTTTPNSINGVAVVNLELEASLTEMKATWGAPEKVGACIKEYKIIVWDQNNIPQDYTTPNTSYIINPIVPCMIYNVQVTPTLSDAIWGNEDKREKEAIPQPVAAPENQRTDWTQNNVDVTVKIVEYSINMCEIDSIDIKCEYSGSDEALEWMVTEQNVSFDYVNNGNSRPPEKISVNELSPYTDYKCEIVVINSGGTSEATTFVGKTLEDVPNEPQDVAWTEREGVGGNLSWSEPSRIPGILGTYRIYITYENSEHFIPESCTIPKDNVTGDEVVEISYWFESVLPNSKYTATVEASTEAGYGNAAELVFTTKPRESEVVRNLSYDITNILGESYDVTAQIAWLRPCNTNGVLLKFKYETVAVSIEDPDTPLKSEGNVSIDGNEENEEYAFDLTNIEPSFSYTVTVFAITSTNDGQEITGTPDEITFLSPDGYPSAPQDVVVKDITATFGNIQWGEPANKNGKIINYEITITTMGPLHPVPDSNCVIDNEPRVLVVDGTADDTGIFNYKYEEFHSNFDYTVSIKASTSAGYGSSNQFNFQTEQSPSEEVRDIFAEHNIPLTEEYAVSVEVTFTEPCHLNGDFLYFKLTLIGNREGFDEDKQEVQSESRENKLSAKLKPEYNYEGFVEVHTKGFISEKTIIPPFTSPAGVPEDEVKSLQDPDVTDPFTANFQLDQETFTNSMGEIIYFAIILAPPDYEPEKDYGVWNNEWPSTGHWSKDGELKEYQTTPKKWNPFKSKSNKNVLHVFTIGEESCDGSSDDYCNGPLRPDTEYSLRVRGFTSLGYRDSVKITFWTPSDINYGALIGGIVGGAVGLLLIFIIIIILWRRKKNKKKVEDTAMETLPFVPVPIPIGNFVAHYTDYKTNLNKLKAEYTLLETKSVSEQLPTTFAMTDDNKKKNRYINILPFDDTRVKLDRDKNDNYTDYINASFIKGYSDEVEYIATQGPLESTIVDFWRMVIQENISVIIMVAQFVEHDKAKCHQYFPNNHETMNIGDGIEIRCANQVPLGGYIKRTLMVQRELMQMTITHLQYIEWPDFGCPNNTESMLDFCNTVRQCIEQYKSKTIVHCSAGVGRTGTLIALDILFQTIENKGDIDIYKTVLKLRKQRMRMVQTEKQYMFIHTCLAEHISNPKTENTKQIEPIYENVTVKKAGDEEITKDIP